MKTPATELYEKREMVVSGGESGGRGERLRVLYFGKEGGEAGIGSGPTTFLGAE